MPPPRVFSDHPTMKRATVTIPNDLEKAVHSCVRAQEGPPSLTAVVQAALREYLGERGFLQSPARLLRNHYRAKGQWTAY
jgi:hypothetical protein